MVNLLQINKNKSFHPVNLGLEVRDSCNLEAKALEESLNFVVDKVPDVCQGNDTNKTGKGGKLAAVIGATKSSVTAQVAKLLRLFKIPQVCWSYLFSLFIETAYHTQLFCFAQRVTDHVFEL